MINLKPLDLANLKLLLAGKTIATKAQIDTLNILRSEMPDLFSGLTKEQLADNKFLIKYLRDPYNRKKIKDALRNEKSLTPTQVSELEESLEEKPAATGGVIYQQGQEGQTGQESPLPAGSSGGGMPSMPSMSAPAIHPIFRTKPPIAETPKPDIAIANKSGYVAEAPTTQFHVTDKAGNIQATYSREPVPAATQPKLVLARSDGSIIQPTPKKSTIHIADRSGNVVKTYNIKSPSALRNFGSNLGSKINIGLNKGINSAMNKAVSGINNFSLGGSGSIFRKIGRFGRGGVNTGGKSVLSKGGGKKVALAFSGIFILIFFIGAFSGAGGTTPTTGAAPISGITPPTGTPADIASCKFTRGGDPVKELTYKSPLLLSYIQEAANLTNIPPVVLAAFIRVETPGTVTKNDDEIRSLSSVADCPRSKPTGALGVMQLQPIGTLGHDEGAIANGAKLINKEYNQLTEEDYCDVRKNIIMGAGFILKKMSYLGLGDGSKWDPQWTNNKTTIDAMVESYYGCLLYGGNPLKCEGPYNYGDDVSTSIQNCQITTPTLPPGTNVSCPVTNGYISCASYGTPYTGGGAGAFAGNCAVDSSGNGGHCNTTYQSVVGICPRITDDSGNLIRTAKSIDVYSPGENLVYLPTIKGQSLNWIYQGYVNAGQDFGEIRLFKSEPTPDGAWSIHFVHVEANNPPIAVGEKIPSGALGAKMINMGSDTHVHVTIGLNVGDSVSDLKDYSPNWLFADRNLKMCVR